MTGRAALVTFASALTLIVTLADPAGAAFASDSAKHNYAVKAEQAKSVPVQPVPKHPQPRPKTPKWDPAAVKKAWPKAGSADAAVPASTAQHAVQAGSLPVWVAPAAAPSGAKAKGVKGAAPVVGKVRVEMAKQSAATQAGVAGVLASVRRSDGGTGGGVHVELDYRSFADSYGGDWASRLRLVQLPSCALTTPELAACQKQTPLVSTNNAETGRVAADLPLGSGSTAQPAVFAATAGAAGGGGSFGATSLSPSGQWSAGGATGGFSWSYPIGVPDVPGGLKPNVALDYSSQSVDGRTSSTNSQASWIGDGWDYSPGYVERSYASCSDDTAGGSPKTGDQCWSDAVDTLTLSLNGSSNTLVYDDKTKVWRPQSDNGEKISVRTDTVNGDNDHEYWVVTTADGNDYYFGKNQLPGWTTGKAVTNSTWTTPVFGNDAGEPCHASTFAASSCQQAYRWNLDYVVDSHNNAMSFWYTPETGYYGVNNATAPTAYTRSGNLAKIQYGQVKDKVYDTAAPAAGQVFFDTSERCLADKTFDCAESKRTAANSSHWPDVPIDQTCASTGTCANHGPSFWTTKRLTTIRTQALVGSAYKDMDSWALTHDFPATGDTTTPSLWLSSIVRTGKANGTDLPLPPVTFDGQAMANRVDGLDGFQPITRRRMMTIRSETGDVIQVNYLAAQCHRKGTVVMPDSPQTNTMRCYPSYWTQPGHTAPDLDWFNKYVVNTVTEQDTTGNGLPQQTSYRYVGNAFWRFNDDPMSQAKFRTYNQWRGYGKTEVRTGSAPEKITLSSATYFRGTGAKLTNSVGDMTVTDSDALAGQVFETQSFNGDGGAQLASTTTEPWLGPVTATHVRTNVGLDTPLEARAVNSRRVRTTTPKADGTSRTTETVTNFDTATALPTSVDDKGDLSTASDDKCSRTWYATDAGGKVLPVPRRMQTVAVNCDATPKYPDNLITDDLSFFDNHTDNLAAPGIGDVTMVQKADSVAADGTPHYVTVLKNSYDSYGREITDTDALGRTTTTQYTAATATAPASVKVTQPKVTGQTAAFATSTTADARGLPVTTTDAAGYTTTNSYDSLGRLMSVWKPGFSTSNGPNVKYTYNLDPDDPSTVTTQTLTDDGSYLTSISMYDAMLRPRETQTQTVGGRVVVDTVYDSHGWTVKTAGPYFNTGAPDGSTMVYAPDNQVPTQTGTFYDGAGRVTDAVSYTKASETWRTTTSYPGSDRTDVVPPEGSTPSSTFTDARGNTTKLTRYHGRSTSGASDSVTYAYDSSGRQVGQDDGQHHTWSSTYDLLGRKTAQDDPDTGHTSSTYDLAGQVLTSTDARLKTISLTYDEMGRQKAKYDTTGGVDAAPENMLASWTYDTLKKGLPTSSTSYAKDATGAVSAYTSKVLGYDSHGWTTASALVVPAGEGKLAGTYLTQNQYNATGSLHSYTDTAAGYLPQETFTYDYDALGRQKSVGSTAMTAGLSWTQFDEPYQFTYGTSGNFAQQTLTYEEQTHRLSSSFVVTASGAKVTDKTQYKYQPSGNVTTITDHLDDGTTDTQCFDYDWAQRLQSAWTATDSCGTTPASGAASTVGGPTPYWQSWTFDATGNRKTQTDHDLGGDAANDTVSTYAVPDAGTKPAHALAEVARDVPGGTDQDTKTSYTYDDAGNVRTRTARAGTDTFTYNSEGKLAELAKTGTAGSTKYVYDASGNLLIRRDAGATMLFTGDQELSLKTGADKAEGSRYAALGGMQIAVHTADAQGERVNYVVSDRQNTAQLQIDAGSQAVTRRQYKPFGEVRTAAAGWQGTKGYVGGQQDDATGLTNLGAREYDPATGHFLNPDPLLMPGDPESWNAYAYANNSPVTMSDPDGLCPKDGDVCGVQGQTPDRPPTKKEIDEYYSTNVAAKPAPKATVANVAAAKAEQAKAEQTAATARAVTAAAKKEKEGLLHKIINLVADLVGITDAVNCFTKGDVMGCVNTALNAVPWGKVFKAIKVGFKAFKIWRAIERAGEVVKDAAAAEEIAVAGARAAKSEANALESAAASCSIHSFTGDTAVLLADGSTKPISDLRPGDEVTATDPQTNVTSKEQVQRHIVTKDDKEFTDLTIAAKPADGAKAEPPAKLTTTWHHPFWDAKHNRWTDAKDLRAGTKLRQPDGATVTVLQARNYRAASLTYDLTVSTVHAYYVLAGATPILVHNCDISMDEAVSRAVSHVGDDATVVRSGSGGVQFMSVATDEAGNSVRKIARFDVNPNSAHVQKLGPHLNLETQINGRTVTSGPLKDPHTPIDPSTIRPGDHWQ
ncbi:RHS repeat-associated core domain-containing protein [Streptomyces sp. NPDC050738]|uniref:RHS repeat-associated core domain-containing protein n=1 Tax=Streptomyces sp. NPDC050738 TaxID=3154744 RepID=UPI00343434BD